MAQKSRPDPASGNIINADEYEALALAYAEDGVVGHPSDTPVVYADSTGRRVKVRAGKFANVRGYQWYSDPVSDEIVDNLPANTAAGPRIDRLVLRLDRSNRLIRTQYLQGAAVGAGQTPTAPALTQNLGNSAGVFDLPLARWQVAAGYTTVAAGDVINEVWYPQPTGPVLCTLTSRPFGASLYNGLHIQEIDTGFARRLHGSKWFLDRARVRAQTTVVTNNNSQWWPVTGLVLGLDADSVYAWDMFLMIWGPQGIGVRLAMQFPTGGHLDCTTQGWIDASGAFYVTNVSDSTSSLSQDIGDGNGYGYNVRSNRTAFTGRGTITTFGSPGNAQILMTQGAANPSGVQVEASSWWEFRQLA